MPSYVVHARPGLDVADALEDAVLVKDGFSWPAFLFTWIWAACHRMWWVALGLFVLEIALVAGLSALRVPVPALLLVRLAFAWLVGLEAPALRSWTLRRSGRPVADVAVADGLRDAEAKTIARWLGRTAPPALDPVPARAMGPAAPIRLPEPVAGLFPTSERRP